MKSVLISIQPKWVEKILSGEKTIEVRKTRPKIETPFKCYIYMTQGGIKDLWTYNEWIYQNRMKVIGEFVCDKINEYPFSWEDFTAYGIKRYRLLEKNRKEMCLSLREIEEYACKNGHVERLYGLHISDLKIYDKPKPIMQFYKPCPIEWKNCPVCEFYSNYTGTCMNNVDRPPQSWCYVEEIDPPKEPFDDTDEGLDWWQK